MSELKLRPPKEHLLGEIQGSSHSLFSGVSLAETLKITSNPMGATVELDGVKAGTTPFEKQFPGGYFHRTRTVLGARLEHPMVARISLAGSRRAGLR